MYLSVASTHHTAPTDTSLKLTARGHCTWSLHVVRRSSLISGGHCTWSLHVVRRSSLISAGQREHLGHERNSSLNILLMCASLSTSKKRSHSLETDTKGRHSSSSAFPLTDQLTESGRRHFLIHFLRQGSVQLPASSAASSVHFSSVHFSSVHFSFLRGMKVDML